MALVLDSNGMWVDIPSTQPGGLRLNDNFTEQGIRSPKSNVATTDPSPSVSDGAHGYARGSRWINSASNHIFICANPLTGAAVWRDITSAPLSFAGPNNVVIVAGDAENVADSGFPLSYIDTAQTIPVRDVDGYIHATNFRLPLGLISEVFGKFVHLLPGVTGDGTPSDPFTGFDAILAAAPEHSTFLFGDYYYLTATGILISNSNVGLIGTGRSVLRSSQGAFSTQTATSATWVVGTDDFGIGNLVTITFAGHGLLTGQQVVVGGTSPVEYHGCFTIYEATTNTFKYYIKLRETPVTPATGTVTFKRARVMITSSRPMTSSFPAIQMWGAEVRGLILDGENNIEVGTYFRNWQAGTLNHVEYRNFVEYAGKAGLMVNCRFNEVKAVFNGSGVPYSTSATKNLFLLGELDFNNVATGINNQGGAYNVTILDSFLYGATQTLLYIPAGFEVVIKNGNAGGSAIALDFGPSCVQFQVSYVDLESSSNVYIDGNNHTLEHCNCIGTSITILNAAVTRGNHLIIEPFRATAVTNNCTVESTAINWTGTITGTHPEKIIKHNKGMREISVDGGHAIREQFAGALNTAGISNISNGARAGYFLTTLSATYIVDNTTLSDYSDATILAAAAFRIIGTATHTLGLLTAHAGLTLQGNGNQVNRVQSLDGNYAITEYYSAGVALGYIAVGNGSALMYISANNDSTYTGAGLEANYTLRLNGRDAKVGGTLGAGNLLISGNGVRKSQVISLDTNTTVYELFTSGDVRGYMAAKNQALYFSANGASGTYADSDLVAEYNFKIYQANRAVRFGGYIGFYDATPVAKPTVTGSRSGNAALASLLTQLATLGLITDSSS